nr:DUF4843 domain-containing protein [Sphingobacterium bovistauri]
MLSYDFGSGIAIYKKAIAAGQDSMTVSFAVKNEDVLSDTIELPIRIVGHKVNFEREVSIGVVEDETTAISSHYELLPTTIPADSYEGTLRVKVNKTESLNTKEARIKLTLKDSEYFKVGPKEQSSYLIKLNNYLTRPASWNDIRFGEYSQEKYKLIIRETGYSDFTSLHPEVLIFIVAKCRNYLTLYLQTHGEEMKAENGLPVRFP